MSKSSDVKKIDDLLREIDALAGWRTGRTRNNHYILYPPDGQSLIHFPSTPSDHRWMKNLRAEIRKAGYDPKTLA